MAGQEISRLLRYPKDQPCVQSSQPRKQCEMCIFNVQVFITPYNITYISWVSTG